MSSLNENLTPEKILSQDTTSFIEWLDSEFGYEIPSRIETPEDITYGLDVLYVYATAVEYLETLCSYAKAFSRQLKRGGKEQKAEYEDMIDKKEAVENKISAIKLSYQTVNKAVTIAFEQMKTPQIFNK